MRLDSVATGPVSLARQIVFASVLFIAAPLLGQLPNAAKPTGRLVTSDDFRSTHKRSADDARVQGAPRIPAHLIWTNGEPETGLRRLQAARRRAMGQDEVSSSYTMADLDKLSYSDLVALLVTLPSPQITDLFVCDAGGQSFYQDEARVQYLLDALQGRGATYTADDDQGVIMLIDVIRAGYYLSYFCPNVTYLYAKPYQSMALPAVHAIQTNSNFRLGTITQSVIIGSTALLIDDGTGDVAAVNNFTPILRDFNDHWATDASDYYSGSAVYWVMMSVDFVLSTQLQWGPYTPQAAGPFAGTIDGYLNEIGRMSNTYDYDNPSTRWVIDDGVYFVGYDGRFHSTANFALTALTTAIQKYGNTPWVYASAQGIETIHRIYNDTDSNGQVQDWEQFKREIRVQYTPVAVDFDCGLFHTRVGSQVDPDKIKTLIWAHKETRAQFFRALRSDVPVDPSHHADDSLTIIIYNSPEEYRMNRFAYELATNNGGIYIENMGTFFSYERTPQQSYYTLEELFRHEGVHYLQGRYEEPGYFGDSPLYDNCRVTWMDEGSAEFFAGSTRTEGVKVRSIEARLVAGDDPSTWYTISDVVHACYGNFVFYHYADAFVGYLYHHNRWDNYMSMLDRLMENDANGFSAITAQDAADSSMTAGYHDFLQYLTDNAQTFPTPSTSPDYLNTPQPKAASQIYTEIQAATGLTNLSATTTTGCTGWDTYTLRGTYASGASTGSPLADWQNMDTTTNAWLVALGNGSWSGYHTATAYFTNYQTDGAGQVTWQVVFHGLMNASGRTPSPTISSFAPAKGVAGTSVVITGAGLSSATAVQFGGVAAQSFTVNSDTQISAVAPAGGNPGPLSVTTPAGGTGFSETSFKVLALTSFSPAQNSFGNSVALTGAGFAEATQVRFNGTPVYTFWINSDTSMTTWVPGATSGPIEVDTPDGTLSSTTDFVVIGMTSLSPSHGYPGTTVTLMGKAFTGASGVLFGTTPAMSFSVDSDTQITARAPAGLTPGVVYISVTMPTTTYYPPTGFNVDSLAALSLDPADLTGGQSATGTITLSTPALAGGAVIALRSSDSAVQVPNTVSVPARSSSVQFPVTTSPVAEHLVATVTATLDGKTAQLTLGPVLNPAPSVSSLSPSSTVSGGSGFTLTVNGANFVSSSVVRWNGSDRTTTYVSNAQLQAAILAADIASAGSATVTVSTPAPGGGVSTGLTLTVVLQANFTLATNASLTVVAGSSNSMAVTETAQNGFSSPVSLSASGVPAGVSAIFSPATRTKAGSSTATFTASSKAAAGTYTIIVSGAGGGLTRTASFSLIITSPPSFTLTAVPSTVSMSVATTAKVSLTTVAGKGFKSALALSVSGLPKGVSAVFSPSTIPSPGSGTSQLTLSDTGASTGTYNLTVTAAGGAVTQTQVIRLTVLSPSFTLTLNASSVSLKAGASKAVTATATAANGFKSAVALSVSSLPKGVTAVFFPSSISAGKGSSTLTLKAASGTGVTLGTYNLTVTGAGGGVTQSRTLTLSVTK
jgi:microbial collagenase